MVVLTIQSGKPQHLHGYLHGWIVYPVTVDIPAGLVV